MKRFHGNTEAKLKETTHIVVMQQIFLTEAKTIGASEAQATKAETYVRSKPLREAREALATAEIRKTPEGKKLSLTGKQSRG